MKTAVYVSGRNTGTVVSRWLHMRLFVSCKLPVSQSVIIVIIIMSTTVFVALSSWREFTRSCVCSLRLPESQFHMIGISAPSHFSCCVHASVTKNCFVVVRLLGTKRGFICETLPLPSVLWRCWLGGRKGIRPVKNWEVGAGVVICLERGADWHMAQLMPMPLTVSCFSIIQIGFTFLVPAHRDVYAI